jgi:hypothetical protein
MVSQALKMMVAKPQTPRANKTIALLLESNFEAAVPPDCWIPAVD